LAGGGLRGPAKKLLTAKIAKNTREGREEKHVI
jgi:hypothetical protein